MSGPIIAILVVILVIAVLGFIIFVYNSLISLRNKVQNSWAQIDVELQRRFDLIPNLVETVKGYMNHEEAVLTRVTELRTSWGNAKTITEKAKLEKDLSSNLKSISVIAEQYPDLKANTNFLSLQDELSSTETKISTSRANYNNVAMIYNTKLEIFPNSIIAGLFHFEKSELFKVDNEEVKQNVKVKF